MKRMFQKLGKAFFACLALPLAVLTFSPGAFAQFPCPQAPEGPASWWAAEGDANDVTGLNNGTPMNGVGFSNAQVGQGFDFDGVDDFVEIPYSPSLSPSGSFSIEAWIYPRVDGDMAIFDKWSGAVSLTYAFHTYPGHQLQFAISDVAHAGDGSFHYFGTTNVLTLNSWNHVAAVYDQSTGKRQLYANGVKVAERTDVPITIYNGNLRTSIGANSPDGTSTTSYFNGVIDELAFFSRALSATEVQAIFTAGASGKCDWAPIIATQPQSRTVYVGTNVALSVLGSGVAPLAYQWQRSGTNLTGETASSLSIPNAQVSNSGNYSVVVTNSLGGVTSSVATVTVLVPPACATPLPGVVSWWTADGTSNDFTAANNGVLRNGATFTNGMVSGAFFFDGIDDFVEVSNSPSLNPSGSFSIEGWIYPRADANMGILEKWSGSVGLSYALHTTLGLALQFPISDAAHAGDASFHSFSTTNVLTLNNWNHVAAVYDQSTGTRQLFLNGVKVAERTDAPITVTSSSLRVSIGANSPSSTTTANYFKGAIDELTFYARALTVSDVQAIYNAAISGKCKQAVPPLITAHPTNRSVVIGTNTTFMTSAVGSQPFTYQWFLNNSTAISGATNVSLTLSNVQFASGGNYSVVISNAAGAVTSSNALLTVTFPNAVVRVVSTNTGGGATTVVPVQLIANGNEGGVSFSLNFSNTLLTFSSVTAGSGAGGAILIPSTGSVSSGKLGLTLLQSGSGTFAAGTQEIARVTFTAATVTNATNTTISFGDQPTPRQITDSQANNLAAWYSNGVVSIAATEYEADVAPRTNRDHAVTLADWIQVGRFVARLDPVTNSAEFQRADCAPRGTRGDGALSVSDWVQAGRYFFGLETNTPADGAIVEGAFNPPNGPTSRNVRAINAGVFAGQTNTLAIQLDALGGENAVGFSLGFDPVSLSYLNATLGTGASGALLNLNTNSVATGSLGVALALSTGSGFSAGSSELLKVSFRAASSAAGNAVVSFGSQPIVSDVSDTNGVPLAANYLSGNMAISPYPPFLKIARSNSSVVVSWPVVATNFSLQTNGTLSSNAWGNLPATPTVLGVENIVVSTNLSKPQFYRLKNP
ncbi:MAG: hypothetical protein EPO07_04030 [Verrucomicrobia bacterium]|nr:MAG: hypothetical protein EPO07_04030 [Verrucomicrobiota bacterium]